jgi:uncharacterized protein YndB with AHSA1/START domain
MITIETLINSTIENTWDAYMNPERMVHWNFAGEDWHSPQATNDLSLGGKRTVRMDAKDGSFGFDFEAVYSEISMGNNFTYVLDKRNVIVEFKELNKQTEITISFDPETENPIELQRNGWQAILNNFKNYTETN